MKSLSKVILALYLLVLMWLVLFKFSFDLTAVLDAQTRSLNLIPFSGNDQREMIDNFIVFIPLGLLLSANFQRASLQGKLAFIGMLSLIAEIIQFVFAIGATDISDVILNTSGGLLGLLLYGLCHTYVRREKLDRFVVVANALLLSLLLTILSFYTVGLHSRPSVGALHSRSSLIQNAQLAWPAAGQAAVGTVEDGVFALSSNREQQHPIASMAKVITALAIMEKQPLEVGQEGPLYVLTAQDVANYRAEVARGGSAVPVHEGMVLTEYQAMQIMLVASANNIADTLAEKVFGSQEAYTSYAQDMVRRMGLSQTVVADASGYSSDTVSTPAELVAIGIAALKNPMIAEIVAQLQAQIPGVGIITNTNELLGVDGVVGIKTGTTDEAGNCLLFAARSTTSEGQTKTIVGVIVGDKSAAKLFSDSKQLLASTKRALGSAEARLSN